MSLCSENGEALRVSPFGIGAGKEVRTPDLNLGKVALYQLSYARVNGRHSKRRLPSVQGERGPLPLCTKSAQAIRR